MFIHSPGYLSIRSHALEVSCAFFFGLIRRFLTILPTFSAVFRSLSLLGISVRTIDASMMSLKPRCACAPYICTGHLVSLGDLCLFGVMLTSPTSPSILMFCMCVRASDVSVSFLASLCVILHFHQVSLRFCGRLGVPTFFQCCARPCIRSTHPHGFLGHPPGCICAYQCVRQFLLVLGYADNFSCSCSRFCVDSTAVVCVRVLDASAWLLGPCGSSGHDSGLAPDEFGII